MVDPTQVLSATTDTVSFDVSLADYPSVAPLSATLPLTVVDECLATAIEPPAVPDFDLVAYSSTQIAEELELGDS